MRKRTIDLVVSIVATLVALLLSWPYWSVHEYWAESQALWIVYIIIGGLLILYVFYAFLSSLHTLFEHDALDHAQAGNGGDDKGRQA